MYSQVRSAIFRMTVAALLSVTAMGCSKKVEGSAAEPLPSFNAVAGKVRAGFAPPQVVNVEQQASADKTLAYEHTMSVEIEGALLAARIEAVEAACKAVKEGGCTLLEIANNQRNAVPTGRVRLRLSPSSVGDIRTVASEGGKAVDSRTSAEDLAQPLADTDRQLALLNLHRQRLTEFMSRKDMKVADLITVSRELATVQSQLDEFGAQRANLRRRVDTELLTIEWSPPFTAYQSASSPILDALKSVGANFKEAIGNIITFLSVLLPWLVIAVPGLFLIRWLWNKIGVFFAKRSKVQAPV